MTQLQQVGKKRRASDARGASIPSGGVAAGVGIGPRSPLQPRPANQPQQHQQPQIAKDTEEARRSPQWRQGVCKRIRAQAAQWRVLQTHQQQCLGPMPNETSRGPPGTCLPDTPAWASAAGPMQPRGSFGKSDVPSVCTGGGWQVTASTFFC